MYPSARKKEFFSSRSRNKKREGRERSKINNRKFDKMIVKVHKISLIG